VGARYGFPQPGRLDGNHRRYTDDDCRLLSEVKRARDTGRSMPEAIAMGRAAVRDAETSIFDGLRLRHPDTEIVTLPDPFMLAISTPLEDEARSHANGALLVGVFQRRSAWRAARSRWDVLAEHAALAIVFADFPRVRRTSTRCDVPVTGTAMSAEWGVICDAPGWRACLVGVESVTTRGARVWPRRTFRAMWSMGAGRGARRSSSRGDDRSAACARDRRRRSATAASMAGGSRRRAARRVGAHHPSARERPPCGAPRRDVNRDRAHGGARPSGSVSSGGTR
jgi:Sensory domain in DIguanylate Cyclases and Two-component system